MGSPDQSNRLPHLAGVVSATLSAMRRAANEAAGLAISVGHQLIEAKALVRHGEWEIWLKTTGLSARTARGYMQLARAGIKTATVADLGIRHALKLAARPPRLIFGDHVHTGQPVWFAHCKAGDLFIAPFLERFHIVLFDAEGMICTRRPVSETELGHQLAEFGVTDRRIDLYDAGAQIALGWVHGLVRGDAVDSPEMERIYRTHRSWCEAVAAGTTKTWAPPEIAGCAQ